MDWVALVLTLVGMVIGGGIVVLMDRKEEGIDN